MFVCVETSHVREDAERPRPEKKGYGISEWYLMKSIAVSAVHTKRCSNKPWGTGRTSRALSSSSVIQTNILTSLCSPKDLVGKTVIWNRVARVEICRSALSFFRVLRPTRCLRLPLSFLLFFFFTILKYVFQSEPYLRACTFSNYIRVFEY